MLAVAASPYVPVLTIPIHAFYQACGLFQYLGNLRMAASFGAVGNCRALCDSTGPGGSILTERMTCWEIFTDALVSRSTMVRSGYSQLKSVTSVGGKPQIAQLLIHPPNRRTAPHVVAFKPILSKTSSLQDV